MPNSPVPLLQLADAGVNVPQLPAVSAPQAPTPPSPVPDLPKVAQASESLAAPLALGVPSPDSGPKALSQEKLKEVVGGPPAVARNLYDAGLPEAAAILDSPAAQPEAPRAQVAQAGGDAPGPAATAALAATDLGLTSSYDSAEDINAFEEIRRLIEIHMSNLIRIESFEMKLKETAEATVTEGGQAG